jgi:hypothetical protein
MAKKDPGLAAKQVSAYNKMERAALIASNADALAWRMKYDEKNAAVGSAQGKLAVGGVDNPLLVSLRPIPPGKTPAPPAWDTPDEIMFAVQHYLVYALDADRPVTPIGLARFLGFANWKEFETFAHDERFEQSNMLWVLEWAKGSVELYMTEAILKGTIRDAAAKPFLAAWFGMDDPQGGKTAPALTISKDFLNALGVGGTVAVRGGDDAKTQISAPEAGNPQA